MKRPLKIVVAGFAVGFPLGGQVWLMLHYALGLARLGHEVLFIEDTGDWAFPFDPVRGHYHADSGFGRDVLARLFGRYGLADRWCYYSLFENKHYGMPRKQTLKFCDEADFFLNISGVIPLKPEYLGAKVKAIVDTDPVFTQMKLAKDDWTRQYYGQHDLFFTFGHNLPDGKTSVPLGDFDWKPTVPPVVLSEWKPNGSEGESYTTVGTWDAKGRDVVIDGKVYTWTKSAKYEAIIDMPSKLPTGRLELCFSGMKEDAARFEKHGWSVRDALVVSRDPFVYRDYIQSSRGEFTIAKEQNVRLKSGWFSDRAATYLASGRPVINEDTGFGDFLPAGEGLFAFESMEQALEIIPAIEADYQRHSQAASRIAREFFDSDKVLGDILKQAGLG
ncbi:MAG: glycosyltransferase family 1 protein [Desulfovibrionaceae bacterium]|nr:glycosyltransferase family 1 protein [Desulfovibrionaceae bacterium]MBF0514977.1 glycosyltransferase family 1 protein [Desulfovibrionaceae bacterium]